MQQFFMSGAYILNIIIIDVHVHLIVGNQRKNLPYYLI